MSHRQAGLSALDVLIAVLVLSVLLFVAARQFPAYEGLSAPAVSDEPADDASASRSGEIVDC